jgi:5-oxoprolinase (ATP-hydrolysing)
MKINSLLCKSQFIMADWKIAIDTGGTFTDCIAVSPDGERVRVKVLSSGCLRGTLTKGLNDKRFTFEHNWPVEKDLFQGYRLRLLQQGVEEAQLVSMDFVAGELRVDRPMEIQLPADFEISAGEEAPLLAARIATQTPLQQALPPMEMRLGTTRGTNALLEKKGAEVVLLITKGFKDLLAIGTQQRPHLFQLNIPDPELRYTKVIEVNERLDARGQVLIPLEKKELERIRQELRAFPNASVAVALMHAYLEPRHEQQLKAFLRKEGVEHLSLSADLSPTIQLLPRAQTAVVNAYLHPVLEDYLQQIQSVLYQEHESRLHVMSSSGGLIRSSHFAPKDSLLSGPAGGVVGSAAISQKMGFSKVLTLDMGGTSTDVARYDRGYDYQYHTAIGGIELRLPTLAIETVAAGGGSICSFEGQRLQVGPESAGAFPGPACYGAGGPLTLTDVNLLLGKLATEAMGIPIHTAPALQALQQLQHQLEETTQEHYSLLDILHGFESIANEKMAGAIRKISIAKGFDPQKYALLVFGGAGGLHACGIADRLEIDTILLPFEGGLLSAYGIGQARIERLLEKQILAPLRHYLPRLEQAFEELKILGQSQMTEAGIQPNQIEVIDQTLFLRLKGQDTPIELPLAPAETIPTRFRERYEQLFGHFPKNSILELERIQTILASREQKEKITEVPSTDLLPKPLSFHKSIAGPQEYPVYDWPALQNGQELTGPCILQNPNSTAFLAKGWKAKVQADQNLLASKTQTAGTADLKKEAIELELFANRFTSIAEEMGAQLQRTAFSVNIKERLDFSCALLTPEARLLVNAPHIPVHLGSLGICARLILDAYPIEKGDVILTNHPAFGGSHLPDLTLFCGVYDQKDQLIGYLINRAHHAEIGGMLPGSMPPQATNLQQEGVVFPPTYLVKAGIPQWATIERHLREAPYPSRAVQENLADLQAALAALRSGAQALRQLADEHGSHCLHHYMNQLKSLAGNHLTKAVAHLEGQRLQATEKLDDGHQICVCIHIRNGHLEFDFEGTSAPHPHNLNANLSIVYSAIIYVLRLLVNQNIPLNGGLMERVTIRLPESSFLHPSFSEKDEDNPAVVGGNTEVSQRLVDTLLKAFGLAACSQGTMNNLLFGNDQFGYYETIGGGTGAGPGFKGRSAVHQHMTNTRITDPEILEARYPVRLHRFEIRENSGGEGLFCGGDGICRELEFLSPVEVTLISQHRNVPPYGLQGGAPGAIGQQFKINGQGQSIPLDGISTFSAQPGERLLLLTPGGGGYGTE